MHADASSIVDDEPGVRSALERRAARRRLSASTPSTAARRASSGSARQPYDVVVLDIWLPGMDGLATLDADARAAGRRAGGHDLRPRQRRVGGARDQARRVRLRREAAVAREDVLVVAQRAAPAAARGREPRAARAASTRSTRWSARATRCAQLREQIAMAAPTNGRVLITGENGTGKELVARAIHALSRARARPVRRGQLRGDSRGADRERAVRPRARARSPARSPSGAASSSWPTAARSSSTRSAT